MTAPIPFARPDVTPAEIASVLEVLESGWLTTGPQAHAFEEEFAAAVGAPIALAVNSATSGLLLALEASGVGDGHAVLVPSVTFASSAAVVRHLGADPILADVSPRTGLATAEHFAAAADRAARSGLEVRVIMPVHLAGQACEMDDVIALAGTLGATVVEDAAHAFPTTYRGRAIGTIGDFTVFSFYATKTVTTGEGGMVTTDDERAAARIRSMRLHGFDWDAWDRYRGRRPKWRYEVVAPGYKCNMPDLAAALGRVQLARVEEMWARRSEIAGRYRQALRGSPIEPLRIDRPDDRHSWHLFVVQLGEGLDRDGFITALGEAGIGTSVHFIPLHRMPYYRDRYQLDPRDFPGAEGYFRSCVSLPIYSVLSDAEVDRVIDTCLDVAGRRRPTASTVPG